QSYSHISFVIATTKAKIDGSNVFKIIKMMPKGAGLHMHDATVGDTQYIAHNLTRWENLYYCVEGWDHLLFRFFDSQPTEGCSEISQWKSVARLRQEASSEEWVDNWFLSSMSMITPTPEVAYPDTNAAWDFFEKKITTISGIINYDKALKDNYYQVLQQHYDDNVMYIEMRGLLSDVYTLNQTPLTTLETLRLFKETSDEFVRDHPDFWGAKYIYAPHRFHTPDTLQEMVNNASTMKATFPDYFAGFDLVGQEDKGTPLIGFLPQLLDAASKDIKFFFHSGETDWHGTKIDENIIDAALLNTTRFAHGYALHSHPYIYEMAKRNNIATEVCPISNQVLRLVEDLRNHPATNYLREGFPVVVASDGPGMWGSSALSHDWYMAFMAIAGRRADIRFLKQLAINSIRFSAMSNVEREDAFAKWEVQWDNFLDKVIGEFSSLSDACMANEV
ncbi:Adenosine deaminase CECR1, partial [Orchesella cincta]